MHLDRLIVFQHLPLAHLYPVHPHPPIHPRKVLFPACVIKSKRPDMNPSSGVKHSVAHINRLPNELLIQVFLLYAEAATPTSQRHTPQAANMRWLPLMLVCRYWRDVALATPVLWRVIHAAPQTRWTTLVLARSAPATVDFTFGDRGSLFTETFKVLSGHVDRLQRLRFVGVHGDLRPAALKFVCGAVDFPNLESLEFLIFARSPDTLADFADMKLSSERYPSLRSLQLCATIAPQDISLCSKLRVLSLTRCLCAPSFDAFLDILSSCSLLQELTLVACLQYLPDEWGTSSTPLATPIHLPDLTALSLRENPPEHTSRFLSSLFLPLTVKVTVMSSHRDEDVVPSISCILPPRHAEAIPALAQVTDIKLLVMHEYALRFDNRAPPLPGVFLFMTAWKVTLSSAALDLTRVFGCAPLTRLVISSNGTHIPTADVWASIFRTFPRLQWLRPRTLKSSITMANPFRNLPVGLHHVSRSGAASPACPELGVIIINGLATDIEYFDAWVECLRCRSERGLVLPKLEVGLRGSEEDMDAMSRVLEGRLRGLVSEYTAEPVFLCYTVFNRSSGHPNAVGPREPSLP
ncbi:hypothetical protein GSI_09109 [Ganoderma sinense ZZ0214-1]|uniref:F-box domain-containing protein n=1 Tax=Ganoderma sinense ZZ0214-1 TaxID=1077348 RepID=A0A2G8S5M2_9APHY|nr:hypothetical protein GSI_09109 [Ganoderma sinense ZZ0214-1]